MLALCIGRQLNLYVFNFSNIFECTRSINSVNPLKGHHPISGKLRHWSLQIYIWEAHKYLCYLPPEAQLNPGWTQFWPLAVVARWCNWGSNHYSGLTLLPDTARRVSLDPKNLRWTYEITVLQILIGELALYEYRVSCFDRKKSLEHQWNLWFSGHLKPTKSRE